MTVVKEILQTKKQCTLSIHILSVTKIYKSQKLSNYFSGYTSATVVKFHNFTNKMRNKSNCGQRKLIFMFVVELMDKEDLQHSQ